MVAEFVVNAIPIALYLHLLVNLEGWFGLKLALAVMLLVWVWAPLDSGEKKKNG